MNYYTIIVACGNDHRDYFSYTEEAPSLILAVAKAELSASRNAYYTDVVSVTLLEEN